MTTDSLTLPANEPSLIRTGVLNATLSIGFSSPAFVLMCADGRWLAPLSLIIACANEKKNEEEEEEGEKKQLLEADRRGHFFVGVFFSPLSLPRGGEC